MKIRIFGESHAPEIGVEIDGVPAGTRIDMEELQAFLVRTGFADVLGEIIQQFAVDFAGKL